MTFTARMFFLVTAVVFASSNSVWAAGGVSQSGTTPVMGSGTPAPDANPANAAPPSLPPLPDNTSAASSAPAVPALPPVTALPVPTPAPTPAPAGSMIDNKVSELKLPGEAPAQKPADLALPPLPDAASANNNLPPVTMPPAPDQAASDNKGNPDSKAAKKKKPSKKRKKGKKKKSSKEAVEKKPIPKSTKYILPEEIYKKSYDRANRHLPIAHYEREYDNLLFTAAKNDDINGLRSLINEGHDVNQVNSAGDTPLLVAIKNNSVRATFLLLKHGAETNVLDANGLTPLQVAVRMGNSQIIGMLSSFPQ